MANSSTPTMHRFALLDRSGKNRGTKDTFAKREAELLLGLNNDRRQRGYTVVDRGEIIEAKADPVYDHVKFTKDFWAIEDPTSGSGKPYGVTIGVPYPIMEYRKAVSTKTHPGGVYFAIGNGAILCDKDGNPKPGQVIAKPAELKPEVKEVVKGQEFKVGDRVRVIDNSCCSYRVGNCGVVESLISSKYVCVKCDGYDYAQGFSAKQLELVKQTPLEEAQDRIDGFVRCHNQLRAMLGVTGTREPLVDALKRGLEDKRKERNQAIDSLGKVTDRLEYVHRENAELNLVKNDLEKTIAMKDDMIRNLTNGLLPGTTLLEIRAQEGEDGAIRTYTKHDIRDQGKKARVALGLQAAVAQFVRGCYLEP